MSDPKNLKKLWGIISQAMKVLGEDLKILMPKGNFCIHTSGRRMRKVVNVKIFLHKVNFYIKL